MRGLPLILFALGAAASASTAQAPLVFSGTIIDASNSGDCKALADIDRDGKADPIIAGSSLSWYESGANFARHTIRATTVHKEFTTDGQAADMDGDGDIDIILGDGAGTNNVLWFENPLVNGPGNPRNGADWALHFIGTQGNTVHDIEIADLDNDGVLDVVTSGHGITRIWKRSSGGWVNANISSLAGAGVFIGDIDRDGKKDIATAYAWLKNPGDVINESWMRYPIQGSVDGDECLLADLSLDGRLDLLTFDAHGRGTIWWFEQPPDPTSSAWTRRSIDTQMGAHHPETADFNQDGLPDILAALELEEIAVYINQGGVPPTFEKVTLALSGGHNARIGDIDGDSLPDVLSCDYIGNPPVRVFINEYCFADCDGSAGLSSNDFACFITKFGSGAAYANCDGSPPPLTLNILDFLCFVNRFNAGCP